MQDVCIALAPAGIAGIVLYGSSAAMLIAVAVITAILAEWVYQRLTKQPSTVLSASISSTSNVLQLP